jgi:hypothetical protein
MATSTVSGTGNLLQAFSSAPTQADFAPQLTDLGTLTSTPIQEQYQTVSSTNTQDTYRFKVNDAETINLAMHIMLSNGDPDHDEIGNAELRLYADTDNTGFLSSGDSLLARSSTSIPSLFDNAINYTVGSGTYFAQVQRIPSQSTITNYNLDLSATTPSQPSNLVPAEHRVDAFTGISQTQTYKGYIDNTNTSDVYAFSTKGMGNNSLVTISLTGLSADADIRVIRDIDKDGLVGTNEFFGSSTKASNASESFTLSAHDDFFVQVYQYQGNTSYQLKFDYQQVPS